MNSKGVLFIQRKKICLVGLGYIGLPTAAMFATHGHLIIGVDINTEVVEALNRGKTVIEEPYLDTMVQAAVAAGNLKAQTVPEEADVFIIAVPTPINKDKTADMTFVRSAAESIVPCLSEGNIVILESTSPPGTVNDLLVPILKKSDLDIGTQLFVAHSPERVLPGKILIELVENNRLVGGVNRASCEVVRDLYKTFVKGEIFLTDSTTAEMCKLMENTFRDVNIALANELSILCEKMGINAWEVIELSNKHPRVNLHRPGPGVGGHCIAVDPWFIVEKHPEAAKIIRLGRLTNDGMPRHVLERAADILAPVSGPKKVAVLGVTYKPNVDDMRESPIVELIELMEEAGMEVRAADTHVRSYPGIFRDVYRAAEGCHLVVLGVDHGEFGKLDFKRLAKCMAAPNALDTRNFWNGDVLKASGFNYHLLGSAK